MSTRQLTTAGVLAALVFIATLFLSIPIPTGYGYLHLGDTFVYFCGALLGPFGALPAAVGSLLADLSGVFAVYALPTFVIKGLDAFAVGTIISRTLKADDSHIVRVSKLALAVLVGSAIMVTGYFVTEAFVLQYGVPVATANVFPNAVQGIGGGLLFIALYYPIRSVVKSFD